MHYQEIYLSRLLNTFCNLVMSCTIDWHRCSKWCCSKYLWKSYINLQGVQLTLNIQFPVATFCMLFLFSRVSLYIWHNFTDMSFHIYMYLYLSPFHWIHKLNEGVIETNVVFQYFLDKNKINCDNNQCWMRTIVIIDSCFQLYIYKSGCKSGCFLGIIFKLEFISQQTTNLWYDMQENQGLVAQIK